MNNAEILRKQFDAEDEIQFTEDARFYSAWDTIRAPKDMAVQRKLEGYRYRSLAELRLRDKLEGSCHSVNLMFVTTRRMRAIGREEVYPFSAGLETRRVC
jgi:predicted mannosyl-3-phosphoglycerate phosphatase (HAD superfamily)